MYGINYLGRKNELVGYLPTVLSEQDAVTTAQLMVRQGTYRRAEVIDEYGNTIRLIRPQDLLS